MLQPLTDSTSCFSTTNEDQDVSGHAIGGISSRLAFVPTNIPIGMSSSLLAFAGFLYGLLGGFLAGSSAFFFGFSGATHSGHTRGMNPGCICLDGLHST